jgi:L-iditol 2-dehydrogenase
MLQSRLLAPGDVRLAEVPVPEPSAGELLIAVKAALTCGTDLKAFRRGHSLIPMPGPFGHEFSGVVARRGKGVRGFREGQAVMAVHSAPCLTCRYCKRKLFNLCESIMETKVLGAFAEYVLLPAHVVRQNVFPKPRRLDFAEAALLEPLSCVVHAVEPLGVKAGQTAFVIGAGPIGLLHLLLLKRRRARVAVAEPVPPRLRQAKKMGADAALGTPEKARKLLSRLTPGGMGFDYVFECTGRPEVWEKAVGYLRRGGTLVLFGGCPPGSRVAYDTHRLHYDEITLKGDFHYTPADVRTAYGMLAGGKLRGAGELISGSFPLTRLPRALDLLSRGKGIKYAILSETPGASGAGEAR